MDVDRARARVNAIVRTLENRQFTRASPLHAADLDLERKVLVNDLRKAEGRGRDYCTSLEW